MRSCCHTVWSPKIEPIPSFFDIDIELLGHLVKVAIVEGDASKGYLAVCDGRIVSGLIRVIRAAVGYAAVVQPQQVVAQIADGLAMSMTEDQS